MRAIGLAVLALLCGCRVRSGEDYSFGLVGDVHYDSPACHVVSAPSPRYLETWLANEIPCLRAAADFFAAEPRADFVLQTGDLVSGCAGSRELQERMLAEGWRKTRDCFEGFPFYVVNGNHETYNQGSAAPYAYPAFAATVQKCNARELGRARLERHFWFRHGPDLFVAYDSNVDEYDFVEAAFAANPDARWTFVVGHIPVVSPVKGGIEIDSPQSGNMMEHHDRFLKLLERRGAIQLCGDTHRIGFLDFATKDGRFSQLMGVSVENRSDLRLAGSWREIGSASADFPLDSARKRHLAPGVFRFWLAEGSGAWKLRVTDRSVTAELIEWESAPKVVKRVLIRGAGDGYAPNGLDLGGFPARHDEAVIPALWDERGFVFSSRCDDGRIATNADVVVTENSPWPRGTALEFFFDPLATGRFALDSDHSQVAVFPVAGGRCRTLFIRYPYPPGKGDPYLRYARERPVGTRWEPEPEGVEASWFREGGKIRYRVFIPWRLLAPASRPDFVPAPGAELGFSHACNGQLVYVVDKNYWDDPSTWTRLKLCKEEK